MIHRIESRSEPEGTNPATIVRCLDCGQRALLYGHCPGAGFHCRLCGHWVTCTLMGAPPDDVPAWKQICQTCGKSIHRMVEESL